MKGINWCGNITAVLLPWKKAGILFAPFDNFVYLAGPFRPDRCQKVGVARQPIVMRQHLELEAGIVIFQGVAGVMKEGWDGLRRIVGMAEECEGPRRVAALGLIKTFVSIAL